MKYSSKELKALARTQLSGKYGTYIGAQLLIYVISMILSAAVRFITRGNSSSFSNGASYQSISGGIITLIVLLIIEALMAILQIGVYKMYLDGSRGYAVRLEDVFYGVRHHPDRVILMQLAVTGIGLVCLVPGTVLIAIAGVTGSSPMSLFGLLLTAAGFIPFLYFALSFSQGMILLTDYDDLGPIQALRESHQIMSGNKGRYFYINLSFIGLALLGSLTCYIGYLWIIPYYSMTMVNFYRNISGEIGGSSDTFSANQ